MDSDQPEVTPVATAAQGGPWTRHGHAIPGITVVGEGRPPVARCGGPAICGKCAADAERIRAESRNHAD